MTKCILTFSLLFISLCTFSQSSNSIPAVDVNSNSINADSTVYAVVDSVAKFPGSTADLHRFIERNINPAIPVINGAKKGRYTVVIKFEVTDDGILMHFQPETKYGHGLEEEVIRFLKLNPKWIPAKRNGVNVNSITSFSQVFIVVDQ